MTRDETVKKLKAVMEAVFRTEVPFTNFDQRLQQIKGYDSMKHALMIEAIEDRFGFKFEFEEILELDTIGDVAELVHKKIV